MMRVRRPYPICIMQVAAAAHDTGWKAQVAETFSGSARELSCCLIKNPSTRELIRSPLKCRSRGGDEPTYIGPAERPALMKLVSRDRSCREH